MNVVKSWFWFMFLVISSAALAQNPLNTSNGVKANSTQYIGDLNVNQSWGGNGASGMYLFNAQTTNHAPTSSDWYHFIEMQHDVGNNWTGQIAMGYFTDNLYYRQQNSANWGNWHTLATQDWIQAMFNTRFTLTGSGANKDVTSDISGDLIVKSNTGSRNEEHGAMLEFVIPANVDGSNAWGQGRIVTVAGNGANSNATGKMILGTRRMQNKLGLGMHWYYGDDIVIDGAGDIGIGTLTPKEKLSVNGKVRAHEVKVEITGWPDYVFEDSYKTLSLQEVSAYIKKNKHLPGLPSASNIEENGLQLGEISKGLTEQVEELTLHLIEKDSEIKELKKRMEALEGLLKKIN